MKEIFLENKSVLAVKMENERLEEIISGSQTGSGQRIIDEGKINYSFSPEAKKQIIERKLAETKKIVGLVRKIYHSAKNYRKEIQQVKVNFQIEHQKVAIKNSTGEVVDRRKRFYLAVEVVAEADGRLQKAREVVASTGEFKLRKPEELGRTAAKRACLMLGAKEAPTGQLPVVISGEAGGTMIHEACGHGLEADFIAQKISIYTGRLGEKVASSKISVLDDPTIPGLFGTYKFDDEGQKAAPVVLIEKGILKNYLSDLYYAEILNLSSTGHARRQSFRSAPVPRMANTFVANGLEDPREIIRSVKKGIFVKKLGGGQVEVVSGNFVFEIEEGYLIENGKIKFPVRKAILVGNGPEVLRTCDAVGDDLNFTAGICGKDDLVPVTSGQPTLRIPQILVGGVSLN